MGRIRLWLFKRLFREDLSKLEREIEDEFRFHVDMRAASLEAEGMDREEARAQALSSFGDLEAFREAGLRGLTAVREKERRVRSLGWLGQDLGDGLRQLLRRPGFALMAAGTLALGLAASTAVFTYVNAYNQPFPGAETQRVFQLFQGTEEAPFGPISYPDYLDLRDAGGGLFETAATGQPLFAASVRHETLTEVVFGQGVTGNFFRLMRVNMSLGRGLSPEDDLSDAPPAVVISHRYWNRRYGGDPEVLGQTILLNNQPYTIVGVAGPEFVGSISAFRPEIWLPFFQFKRVYWARSDNEVNREAGVISPYLKISEGADLRQVRESLDVFGRRLDLEVPLENRTRRLQLEPATWIQPGVRQGEEPTSRIMLLAAAFLLLLACANVANLVLSAGTRRHAEMALRAAMGASRGRLIRQLLVENLLLSFLAGGLALILAGPAANRLSSYFARPSVWGVNVPREVSVDLRVLAFGFLVALGAGVLTGVLPALRASGRDLASTLRAGGRWASDHGSVSRRRFLGTRDLLVSVQLALTIALLFLAGLVLRTLETARNVDPGFDTDWTLASYISTSSMGTPVDLREAFFDDLIQRFNEMPWVRSATVSEQAPLSGHPRAGLRLDDLEEPVPTTVARVVPGYFETMEMELVAGRTLLVTDTADEAGVVVVNETLAERMVGGEGFESVVGRQLWWPGEGDVEDRGFQVVGVVRDARQTTLLAAPGPVGYFSLPQHYYAPGNAFLLKVAGDPKGMVSRMEDELHAVDPRIAIVNILPYSEVVGGFLYTQRMNAELFSIIALLGLVLSASGVFGVTSLSVARMKKEIGIRLAIGAGRAAITRLVISRVSLAVGLGLLAGVVASFLGSRLVESLLWGISPTDPMALGLGIGVLLASVALAVSVPLRRAARVDPVETLQAE
ncbi:MAG: ADOP family duplicated permease [Gemmatimonadota bacterium]|jgi:predicted permease